jgi:hypothetical protein
MGRVGEEYGLRFPAEERNLSLLHIIQIGSGAHLGSFFIFRVAS